MKPRVLIADDEPRMARSIQVALERCGMECALAGSGEEALASFEESGADAVVTDWRMPGMDGVELMDALHRLDAELPVVIVTAHADVPSAVAAMKRGAFDYVTKPFDNDELRAVVQRALDLTRLRRENRWLRQRIAGDDPAASLVAESPRMKAVIDLVRRVAPSRATVLIQGESGTGKEVVAKLIHHCSDRVGHAFVAVNCKAFAEGVLESELFGHERGAFTGAAEARAGCFERAGGGTLFLDEIGEVSESFQAKLLRVLQESEVLRVGGSSPRKVDVRVVAATNRRLDEEVRAGRFREDLFFRLNVIPLALAPLRERKEDLLPLAKHFLEVHRARGGYTRTLGEAAVRSIMSHPWPGNVRELENTIERAVILAREETIQPEDLLLAPAAPAPAEHTGDATLLETLDRATRERIARAMAKTGGKKAEAAAELGVDRTTLFRLMKKLGMSD
jgi:DNA-binding NtrC family response regulator